MQGFAKIKNGYQANHIPFKSFQGDSRLREREGGSSKHIIAFSCPSPEFFARIFGKRGRGGNSFSPHPFFFPPRPSGRFWEGHCETPQAFRSKWVRAKFSICDQTRFVKFERDAASSLRSSAERFASKSKGFLKSQEAIFSERRRFGIAKQFTNEICFQLFPFRFAEYEDSFSEPRA